MKLRIEAEPGELPAKTSDLIRALVERIPSSEVSDAILEVLEKAKQEGHQLRNPALKQLSEQILNLVHRQYSLMQKEIASVLDDATEEKHGQASHQTKLPSP